MSISTQGIISLIRDKGRGDPPAALADIFVNPLTRILQFLDTKVQFARTEQTVDTIVTALEDDDALADFALQLNEEADVIFNRLRIALDDIASNFGITRRPATVSKGTVLVLRDVALTSPITIGAGTKFFAPSLDQEYSATETIQITSMTFDTDLNKFVASIPVESVNVGLNTIAAVGQINQIRDNIPDITGVTNTEPLTGGRDEESDRSLSERVKTALSSNNIGTKSGYRFLALSLDDVKDASVVGAGDILMVRDLGDGGSVDIYITDAIPVQVSETAIAGVNLTGTGPFIFTPSRQPVIDTTVSPAADAINKDTGVFAGSIKALDTIEFPTDVNGQTITYFVNDNVSKTQEFFDDDTRNILGSDILIKEAFLVLANVEFTITVFSGFSKSVVQGNVQNVVTQFISNLGIGDNIEQSDIIKTVADIAGVDRIDLPMDRFDRSTSPVLPLSVIPAGNNEVLRVGSVIVNF